MNYWVIETFWALLQKRQTTQPSALQRLPSGNTPTAAILGLSPFSKAFGSDRNSGGKGIGRRLLAHAETLLAARGFRELGSETWIDDCTSQAAHLAWGFSETERVVYFRKILKPPRR